MKVNFLNDPLQQTCENILDTFQKLGPYFQALGDPYRQQIVTLLIKHESMNVTTLSQHISLSRPAISHHLKYLKTIGLLAVDKKGTEMYYRLQIDEVVYLMEMLVNSVRECTTEGAK